MITIIPTIFITILEIIIMAYDLEEQEQLASLKAWWKQYGNLLTWLLIVVLAGYAAWTGWNKYQGSQALQASQLYSELQRAVMAKDNAKTQRVAADMESKFGSTAYAQMSSLAAAESAVNANDSKTAKARLQWMIAEGREEEYKALARIRLSGILLDEKAFEDGLKLLSGDFPLHYAAIAADRRGDIFLAQAKIQDARAAYQSALEKMDERNPGRQLIQIKLDAIGAPAKSDA
jgi:predicted negative regulator of RcsB-dependent stress response